MGFRASLTSFRSWLCHSSVNGLLLSGLQTSDYTSYISSHSPSFTPAATTDFQFPGGTLPLPISGPFFMLPLFPNTSSSNGVASSVCLLEV